MSHKKECLSVLDSHRVGGSNNLVLSLNNNDGITFLANTISLEARDNRVNSTIRFFQRRNNDRLASLHVSVSLTSDLFACSQDSDRSSGTELGNLLRGSTGFGAHDDGLGTNINGGLDSRGGDRLAGGKGSELFESGVSDSGVKGIVVDGRFGFDTGLGHDLDGGGGVFSVGGFSRKHNGVGSVKNGVGDIGTLGAGRTRISNHGFEHLRGSDNGLSDNVSLSDHHLLGKENLFRRNFHTEITTGNHDTIGDIQDFVVVFKTFLVLDLADNLDSLVFWSEDFTNLEDITSLANEGGGDEINFVGDTPLDNILNVLFGQSRKIDNDSGQVHVLALTEGGVVHDFTGDFILFGVAGDDLQDQRSVSNQDGLSGVDGSGQFSVGAGKLGVVSQKRVVSGKDKSLTLGQFNLLGAVGEETGSDFGSLGIEQDA